MAGVENRAEGTASLAATCYMSKLKLHSRAQLTVEVADNPHGDALIIPRAKAQAQLGAVKLVGR